MFFLVSPVLAQENEIDIPEVDEDTEEVMVPIEFMRNALWYRESYYISQDLLDSKETTIGELQDQNRQLQQENSHLSESQKVWRTAFFVTLGVATAQFTVWSLIQ